MIPHKIAYPWFGGNPKPDKIKYCIESFNKFYEPDEIIELDESFFDPSACHIPFIQGAYKEGKWAFIADYAKIMYLYSKGGVAVDADVELLRPLTVFEKRSWYTGQELNHKKLVTALMGSISYHPFLRLMINYYNTLTSFKPIPNTFFITKLIESLSLDKIGDTYIGHDMIIFPQEYFCPYNHRTKKALPTHKTYTLHHFQGSWLK